MAEGECLQTERQHLGKRREGSLRESMSRARAGGGGGPGWTRPRSMWLRSSRAHGPGALALVSMLNKITPSRSRAARGGPQPGPHPLRGGCDLLLAAGNGTTHGVHGPRGDRSLLGHHVRRSCPWSTAVGPTRRRSRACPRRGHRATSGRARSAGAVRGADPA